MFGTNKNTQLTVVGREAVTRLKKRKREKFLSIP